MPDVTVVRVFPAGPDGGNPAPIVLDAAGLSGEEMRDVARRYGHESGFVLPADPGGGADFRFRFFVPNHEMEMCGHATIAALWLLRAAGRIGKERLRIDTLSGPVEAVVPAAGAISVSQPAGEVTPLSAADTAAVREVLGLAPGDLAEPVALNARTSRTKTLVAVDGVARLHALRPSFDRIEGVCAAIGSTGLYPFALGEAGAAGAAGTTVHARQFPQASGYPEDAATGIAAAALAFGLLHWHRATPADTVSVRQGEAMGRPSEIVVSFDRDGDGVSGCWIHGVCVVEDPASGG